MQCAAADSTKCSAGKQHRNGFGKIDQNVYLGSTRCIWTADSSKLQSGACLLQIPAADYLVRLIMAYHVLEQYLNGLLNPKLAVYHAKAAVLIKYVMYCLG